MLNGRCILPIVPDVFANVADGIATFVEMFNCGRWNSHFLLKCLTVAGGIATFVGMFHCGRCYITVADGIFTGSVYSYLNLSSVMLF